MLESITTWQELRLSVKNCAFTQCNRHSKKMPVFFPRKEDTLHRIKFVVVSQDPGSVLLKLNKEKPDSDKMENHLKERCIGQIDPTHNSPIKRIQEIFEKSFDPASDEIYWTHALKCVPTEGDGQINDDWDKCVRHCIKHFENELSLMPSKELAVISLGKWPLALCKIFFHGLDIKRASKLKLRDEMIELFSVSEQQGYRIAKWRDKSIHLFPFIHPSNRNQMICKDIPIRRDGIEETKKKCEWLEIAEKQFEDNIRGFNQ